MDTRGRPPAERRVLALSAVLLVSLAAALALFAYRRWHKWEPAEPLPPMVEAPKAIRTWKDMARKVEEERGEPIGNAAQVSVPAELRHYSDRRRFLAIQVAASREQEFDLPHDYAELAEMIRRDQLVEMPALGEVYILYGVGGSATDDPFTHYDRATGGEIPLYDGWGDFRDAYDEMTERLGELRTEVAGHRAQLRKTPRLRKYRSRRRALQAKVKGGEAAVRILDRRRKLLASFYEDYEKRRRVVTEYRLLHEMAADFGGRSYDLRDPTERLRFKGRLLSFLRPEARDVLLEVARFYEGEFDRPLPVTSLVRTLGYQRRLGQTNRYATQIDLPPHASGMAFDVYFGRMAAGEQQHLMEVIARLESEGRVEALRENNEHIHVFALPDGRRPSERLIALSAEEVAAGRPKVAPARTKRRPALSRPGTRRPAAPSRPEGAQPGPPAPGPQPQTRH